MKFHELKFDRHPAGFGGVRAKHTFPNGWGVSVICVPGFSYGGEQGLYELAVVGPDGGLHYDNPVANGDVRGYLTPEDVDRLMAMVELFDEEDVS